MAEGGVSKLFWMLLAVYSCMSGYQCEECPSGCLCASAEGSDIETPLISCSGIFPSRVPGSANHLVISDANLSSLSAADVSLLGNLLSLHIISSRISSVEKDAFSGTNITSLTDLRLSDNEISSLAIGTFSNLRELRELFLDGNNLRGLGWVLSNLTKLQVLHLGSNYLERIPDDLPKSLTELFLSDNNIHTVQFPGTSYSSLKHLDLCGNSFARLSYPDMSIPESLENLCLGNQFFDIDPLIFSPENSSVHTLNLQTTKKLTSHTLNAINSLHELRSLIISGARIVKLSRKTFRDLVKLQCLSLINMKRSSDIDEDFFSFSTLSELDLSRSPNIANAVLSNQRYLACSVNLKTLKVRDTLISEISNDMMIVFQKLQQLDISDNPLTCDCDLISLTKNSRKRKLYLFRSEETTCLQESSLEIHLILDERLRISHCGETGHPERNKNHDSTLKKNSLFYIVICLIVVISVLFAIIFCLLVKYLKAVRRKRCTVATIF